MLIVWRGWGLLAAALPLVSILVASVAIDLIGGAGSYRSSSNAAGLGLILSGVVCWPVGRRLNGPPVPYLNRNAIEGQDFRPRIPFLFAKHNFLFLPLEAWGALFVVAGVAILVRNTAGI